MTVVAWIGSLLLSPLHAQNPKLEVELVAMSDASRIQRVQVSGSRVTLGSGLVVPPEVKAFEENRRRIDAANTSRLAAIVDKYGWPGKKLAGSDGAHAAWLVLMRASDPALQQRAFGLMRKMRDQIAKLDYAYMSDVVAVQTSRPQTYGTQWTCRDGHIALLTPLRDPGRVNELRAGVGLPRLGDDYKRILNGFASDRPGCTARLIGPAEPRP
jgi:hypothetical protein